MNLREFVKETLKQLIEGVVDAQAFAKESGAVVVPPVSATSVPGGAPMRPRASGGFVFDIDFDVAVMTAESGETKGGAGLFVGWLGAGARHTAGATGETANRVKFTVPVVLPQQRNQA